jgi:hypothetical protein
MADQRASARVAETVGAGQRCMVFDALLGVDLGEQGDSDGEYPYRPQQGRPARPGPALLPARIGTRRRFPAPEKPE